VVFHKTILVSGMIVLAACLAEAQSVGPAAEKKADADARHEKAREALMRRTGGFLTPPAAGPGVLVADMRGGKVALAGAVKKAAEDLGKTVLLPFRYAAMKPGKTLWACAAEALAQKDAEFAVVVVDLPEVPALLAAPEARWAAVNVAPLRAGGADEAALARRTAQEVWRAACLALGAADSQVNRCVMGPVLSPADLDGLGGAANPEYLNKMLRKAEARGVKPRRPVSYRRAVEEGWAPAPANPLQQAVWDEVKAGGKKNGPAQ
jgi:hypothetical protein